MIGPEHYREAERLLDGAADAMDKAARDGSTQATAMAVGDHIAATAQVHATLAAAAATTAILVEAYVGEGSQGRKWTEATS